jgi:hypothetical protein
MVCHSGQAPGMDLLALHTDVARRVNADANPVAADRDDGDADLVGDYNFFSETAR